MKTTISHPGVHLRLSFQLWRAKKRRGKHAVPWENFSEFDLTEAARRILEQYYLLTIPAIGKGVQVASASVEIKPELAVGLGELVGEWGSARGCSLFLLGEIARGHEWLLVDEKERVYVSSREGVCLVANGFEDALIRLVYGREYEERCLPEFK